MEEDPLPVSELASSLQLQAGKEPWFWQLQDSMDKPLDPWCQQLEQTLKHFGFWFPNTLGNVFRVCVITWIVKVNVN
jgi:hypothetical protein